MSIYFSSFHKYIIFSKIKVYINHILKNHNINNMPIYHDSFESGWCCPFCDWKWIDTADFKMRNITRR